MYVFYCREEIETMLEILPLNEKAGSKTDTNFIIFIFCFS